MYTKEQMEEAWNDGAKSEEQRCGEFNINNYTKACFAVNLNSKEVQEHRCEQMEKILETPCKLYAFIDGKYIELKP